MLFSGLSVKDPEESAVGAAVVVAAPPSLLGQGADLLEDVQLELPVRKAPVSANIMDLDAMTPLPASGEEKKKSKKKHKKEHKEKEHRSKKSSSNSSSSSTSSSSAAPASNDASKNVVRKRVQRSNVTRPGYGREEDHPVPVDDVNPTDTEVGVISFSIFVFSFFFFFFFFFSHRNSSRALSLVLATTKKKLLRLQNLLVVTRC